MTGDTAIAAAGAGTFARVAATRELLFFCGKGGVGKTTLAAAAALARPGGATLVGTDPAGALARVLGPAPMLPAGVEVREAPGEALLARFRREHGPTIAAIIEGGTYLAPEDARALAAASLPGIDEVLGVLALAEVAGARPVIVDTAPSAHALRLLALPDAFEAALAVLGAMRAKAREVEAALAGAARDGPADALLASLSGRIARLRAAVRDRTRSGLVAVAAPDAVAVAEARRLAVALERLGLATAAVVLNLAEPPCCERGAARAAAAARCVAELAARFPGVPVFELAREAEEPVGVPALARLGEALFAASPRPATAAPRKGRESSEPFSPEAGPPSPGAMRRAVGRALALVPGAPLLLVGGKGGTGKTTLALHIALSRAAAAPGRRVLLAAVGGGVGLSSALGVELGDAPRPVPDVPNLFAAEVDARARFDRLKAEVRADLARALEKLLGGGSPAAGFDLRYDRAVIEGLLDLAPPGVDEIAGLALLLDEARGFEDIVLDCAPTGHLVRFLEMPRKAREWLALAARLLTRYPELGGAAAVERTISLLRGVRAVAERLADPARTALVVVTLPERLPAAEAAALRNRAAAAGTAPALVIVNRVEPETRCPRCAARREAGLAAARALAAEVAPIPVALVPEAAFAEAA